MRILSLPVLTSAVLIGSAASAQETGVFREADAAMTCAQIGDEAAELSAAMGDRTPTGGWLSRISGIARSGAAMLVPGGALAVAGADAMTQPRRERNEAAEEADEARWYYLNGLHAGRGCRDAEAAPVESSMPSPAPTGAPAISTRDLAPPGSDR